MSDKHIVDYTVIGDAWDYEFEEGRPKKVFYSLIPKVKDMIAQGWQPHGSMAMAPNEEGMLIRQQVLVKYGQPPLQRPSADAIIGNR